MEKVFIYWDNLHFAREARRLAEKREAAVGQRVRIHFGNLYRLAHAGRAVGRAVAAGSVPSKMKRLWKQLENYGIETEWHDRGAIFANGEKVTDPALTTRMLHDAFDFENDPGIVVALSADGDARFHADLQRMHRKGWRIEVLSWLHSCNHRMKEWAQQNGKFIALDDFYDSIAFCKPSPLDLSRRAA